MLMSCVNLYFSNQAFKMFTIEFKFIAFKFKIRLGLYIHERQNRSMIIFSILNPKLRFKYVFKLNYEFLAFW